QYFLNAAGSLWLAGVRLNWSKLYDEEQPRRVALPTYPFERKRYWIAKSAARTEQPAAEALAVTAMERRVSISPPLPEPNLTAVATASSGPAETRASQNGKRQNNGTRQKVVQQIVAQQLQISARQLELMARQLELLRNGSSTKTPVAPQEN